MKLICVLLLAVLGVFQTVQSRAGDELARPNILFIMSDDHACNAISAYGSRLAEVAPTPNIDRIGSEGVRLERCFVTNSICTPSRAVILSGQHSHINGVRTLNDAFPGPDSGTPNVAEILRRSGYRTALIGKWHLRSQPWGFDYWKVGPGQGKYHDPVFVTSTDGVEYGPRAGGKKTEGYYTDLVTDFALDWLTENAGEKGEGKPFFLMLHHKAPHGKWEPAERHTDYLAGVEIPEPESLWEDFSHRSDATRNMGTSITSRLSGRRTMVDDVQKPNWPAGAVDMSGMTPKQKDKAAYQKYLHDYLACVKAVDENVGRVLDYLDDSGLAKDTLVIYTSDQGMFLGEHDYFDKRWIYEECFKMPFLARLPGVIPEGAVNDAHLCSNLDFAQTLIDFAGLKDASGEVAKMQGRSLFTVLSGGKPEGWREAVYYRYWMHGAHHHIPGHYGLRTDRYKLAFFYGLPLDANIGKPYPPTTPGWELYDLKADPSETNNVYGNPEYAEVIESLKAQLLQLKKDYRDGDEKYPALMKVREAIW